MANFLCSILEKHHDDEISTLERISTAYSDKTDEYVDPEKVDTDLIDKIKQAFYDFAKNHPSDFTQFTHNVCTVLQCTCVNLKYNKLLYFVPTFYLNKVKWEARKQEAEAKKQAFIANEYAGSVGDKITTEATLTRYSTFDGGYGIMYVYNFKDVHGHVLVWFTSKVQTVNEGDTITIKGTVKKLSEYKGIKQTILTRCKVL